MSTDRLATGRRVLWAGVVLQVLGIGWDAVWHRRNPGALEAGWALLEAHGVVHLGLLVVGAGSLVAFRGSGTRPGALSWYALAGYGALGQAVGRGWDAWAHAAGQEVAVAHLLSRFGLLLVLAAVVLASLEARGGREAQG